MMPTNHPCTLRDLNKPGGGWGDGGERTRKGKFGA